MKGLLYFFGIFTVFVAARPQQDHNLCKTHPELPYCKIENLEFHISRVISAEPKPDPNIISKKLIEPDQNSVAPNPILSNDERELAIKDSKQPIEVLVEEHRSKKSRDKREIDDSSSFDMDTENEYLTYRRQRAKILNQLNNLDDKQRSYQSSSGVSSASYPSSASSYPSYGQSSSYGYPGYGGGGGFGNTFGIGSGLNVMGVGVSSGLSIGK